METAPDLTHPDFISDPHSVYRRLRAEEPLHWNPSLKGWVITRHADVCLVLKDPRFSAAKLGPFLGHIGPDTRSKIERLTAVLADWMVFNDPPRHEKLRKPLAKYFLPQEIARLQPMISQRVEELLDSFKGRDRVDFIEAFAFPLPAGVISDLFGVPRERVEDLRKWSEDLKDFVALARATPATTANDLCGGGGVQVPICSLRCSATRRTRWTTGGTTRTTRKSSRRSARSMGPVWGVPSSGAGRPPSCRTQSGSSTRHARTHAHTHGTHAWREN